MRDIKFRAWNRNTNSWNFINYTVDAVASLGVATTGYAWCQSTGLYDKRGHLIYEGDIINPNHEIASHHYRPKIVEWKNTRYYNGFNVGKSENGKCEIIGNIYENKDLL